MESPVGIRLFVADDLGEGQSLVLNKDQSHYLVTVMRRKTGDQVRLFNGRDGEWRAVLTEAHKKSCIFNLKEQLRPQETEPDLWLLFAPIKKTPIDYVAQKATELGVSALMPVLTRYTAATRVNEKRLAANAREAAEQCERLKLPEIHELQKINAVLSEWPADRILIFCDEGGGCQPILTALQEAEPSGKWAVLIGPEGGFAPEERKKIRALPQTLPVSLGGRLLRADTAAIAALSVWNAVLG